MKKGGELPAIRILAIRAWDRANPMCAGTATSGIVEAPLTPRPR